MIKLRKLEMKDADGMLLWMKDPEVQKGFRRDMSRNTRETVLNFINSACYEKIDGGALHFALTDESNEYMGTMTLKDICVEHNHADVSAVISPKFQGRGLGVKGMLALCKIAFEEYDFERLNVEIYPENIASTKMTEKCGFIFEGCRKHCLYIDGQYKDLNCYRLLKEEYFQGK